LSRSLLSDIAENPASIAYPRAAPEGGYFVSCDLLPGLASTVVALAAEAGVKLTPAGATFPYGRDPEDRNIRLSPTFPPIEELEQAMEVFVTYVKLASVRDQLKQRFGA
jgi:DNA-binding transcriptional MocR family regulator